MSSEQFQEGFFRRVTISLPSERDALAVIPPLESDIKAKLKTFGFESSEMPPAVELPNEGNE